MATNLEKEYFELELVKSTKKMTSYHILFMVGGLVNIYYMVGMISHGWAENVIRMIDERTRKTLIYSQLDRDRNIGRLWLKYRHKPKNDLIFLGVLVDIVKQAASVHKSWRAKCHKTIKTFDKSQFHDLKVLREKAKV